MADHALQLAAMSTTGLEARLEQGEVVTFSSGLFPLPQGEDLEFLLRQSLRGWGHKNISYNPSTGKVTGFRYNSSSQAERLGQLLADFSCQVSAWLGSLLPGYACSWKLDRASFRPEEEATRKLRLKARNDLLHIDAFPTRPSNGWRLLRCFVNVHPSEPRVWVTSEPFARLLQRFGAAVGVSRQVGFSLLDWRQRALNYWEKLVKQIPLPGAVARSRSAYDAFMLRFHDFLKRNEDFQERGPKRLWKFPPGSVWLAMTDSCSHAVLRGRFALEHSFFLAPESLFLPDQSPATLLARAGSGSAFFRAA
jgi:hypothetical protein